MHLGQAGEQGAGQETGCVFLPGSCISGIG